MSVTGLAIIYIIIWWIVFFAILPIDVNRLKTIKIEGEDPGSPENPKMLKKSLQIINLTKNHIKWEKSQNQNFLKSSKSHSKSQKSYKMGKIQKTKIKKKIKKDKK